MTSLETFRRLREDWNDLLEEGTRHRPYREHEYFDLWLRHHDLGGELSICLVKRDQRIEAIFPFVLKRAKYKTVPLRQLEFLGPIGAAMRTPIFRSDDPSERETILDSLLRFLVQSVRWDTLRLNFLPAEDFDLQTLERVLSVSSLACGEHSWFGDWYLDSIDVTSEQYLATRPKQIRRNARHFARQFPQEDGMRLEIIAGGDDEALERGMHHFHTVYEKSWKKWEADPGFDRALARMARDKGYLRLGLLFIGDHPVAAQLWLVCNRTAYGAKKAYDQAYKKFSPGVALTAAMAAHVIDKDEATELDFLFGDDAYKKDWVPLRRERKDLIIFNRQTLRGWLLGYVIPALKG